MTYKNLLDRQNQEANEFSQDKIYFIFGSENEIYKQLEETGHSVDDFINIGGGGFLLKEYKNEFYNLLERHGQERKAYLLANVYEVVNYYYWDYLYLLYYLYNFYNVYFVLDN